MTSANILSALMAAFNRDMENKGVGHDTNTR